MPTFLFQAADAAGNESNGRVDAPTLAEARVQLETRGYRQVRFLQDDIEGDIKRTWGGKDVQLDPEEWTAEMEIEARQRRGVAQTLWWSFKQHFFFLGPLLLWNAWSLARPPLRWWDWAGFAATLLYLRWFAGLVAPSVTWERVQHAAAWCDWKRQRRLFAMLRAQRERAGGLGVPEMELLIREAYALAAQGDLPAAMRLMEEKVRPNPDLAEYLYLCRLATVYEYGGQFDRQLVCVREANEKGAAKSAAGWIDLAGVLARRTGDFPGARAALDQAAQMEMSQLARALHQAWSGIVASAGGDFESAQRCLRTALTLSRHHGPSLMIGLERELEAHLAIACVARREHAEAQRLARGAIPLLRARGEHDLIRRVEAALAA